MRITSKRNLVTLLCAGLPLASLGASPVLCGASNFERSGQGWLSSPAQRDGTVSFKTNAKLLELPATTNATSVNAYARAAANKAFAAYMRKASPPPAEGATLVARGVQAAELKCSDATYLVYQVEASQLAWELPEKPVETNAITDLQNMKKEVQSFPSSAVVPVSPPPLPKPSSRIIIED